MAPSRPAFSILEAPQPVMTTAIHAGHDLRPELADLIALDEAARRREEDPFTDELAVGGNRVVVHRSRFEVDLNRPADRAVYQRPDDAWGLQVWRRPLPPQEVERSLAIHGRFYAAMANCLDRLARQGPFAVLDIHSYNHRRDGVAAPPVENPELNVGTDDMDRSRWSPVVDPFVDEMRARLVDGHHLDVRENVRFCGGHLAHWVHERYPDRGCVLALEFKKVFMDEQTGVTDADHLAVLRRTLAEVIPTLADLLTREAA